MTFKEFLLEYRVPTKVIIMDALSRFTVLRSQAAHVPLILSLEVSHVEFTFERDEATVYLRLPEGDKVA